MAFRRICSVVGTTVVVDIRPPVWGVRATQPRSPLFVRSSGEDDGGDGVNWMWRVRRRWRWIWWFISAFAVSKEDKGEGVESREEIRMGEERRDMFVWTTRWICIKAMERSSLLFNAGQGEDGSLG